MKPVTGPFTGEQRFSVYYAVLFGTIGALAPFVALWLDYIGITAGDIGLIVAAPSLVMLATTVTLGRWADGLRDRRLAIISCNWVILLAHGLLFLSTDFWMVLMVWIVSGVAMYANIPITDASALGLARRHGSDYARIRMFGSIGFVVAISAAGLIYEKQGIGIFLWLLFAANLIRLYSAYSLPAMPAPKASKELSAEADALYSPGVLLTLSGSALINASHAMVNTFGILNWTMQGISESLASLAIGIGVVVEIALLWWFRSLTRNVSARVCLVVAATCGMLRWLLLASEPSLFVIFVAQTLHGVTFGVMFLASATFISRRVPERSAARGQGLLATITTACMATGTFVSGQLYDVWAGDIYWLMSAMCLVALLCIAASYRFSFGD